jgi:hypothetical protein
MGGRDSKRGHVQSMGLRFSFGVSFFVCFFGVFGNGGSPRQAGSAPCHILPLRGGEDDEHSKYSMLTGLGRRVRSDSANLVASRKYARLEQTQAPDPKSINRRHDDDDEPSQYDGSSSWGGCEKSACETVLNDTGPGAKMMKKMGFDGGGLGRSGKGIREPVAADLSVSGPASVLLTGREGIGLRPAASRPKLTEDEILFSDISDVADEKAFGSGNARLASRAWFLRDIEKNRIE